MTGKKFSLLGSVAALALAAFTGAAFAGNGNGNGNQAAASGNSGTAPGQVKKTTAVAPPTAPQQTAATQSSKPSKPSGSTAHGNSTKTGSPSASGNSQPSTPGMKPANNTAHGTTCVTGGSSSGVTCSSVGSNTAAAAGKSDASKRYGNGKTAAQIATSNGAPAGTSIYGPGNSQPHKVTTCQHPLHGNGGGVDVHAVKNYSNAACTTQTQQPSVQQTQSSTCGSVTTSSTTTKLQRGHAYGLLKQGKSLHSKTITTTVTLPTGETCTVAGQTQQAVQQQVVQVLTQALGTAPTQQQIAQATKTQTSSAKGGVLGAFVSKNAAKAAAGKASPASSRGGVLGAFATVGHSAAHGTLPFTGFPIWVALLIGAALIAAGLLLAGRRRNVRDVV